MITETKAPRRIPPPVCADGVTARPIRLPVVHHGRQSFPHVGDFHRDGLTIHHKGSGQNLPLPWLELLRGGALAMDCTPAEFAAHLIDLVNSQLELTTPSAHSGPTSARAGDGQHEHRAA